LRQSSEFPISTSNKLIKKVSFRDQKKAEVVTKPSSLALALLEARKIKQQRKEEEE